MYSMRAYIFVPVLLICGCHTYNFGHDLKITGDSAWQKVNRNNYKLRCNGKELTIFLATHKAGAALSSIYTYGIPFAYRVKQIGSGNK